MNILRGSGSTGGLGRGRRLRNIVVVTEVALLPGRSRSRSHPLRPAGALCIGIASAPRSGTRPDHCAAGGMSTNYYALLSRLRAFRYW